MIIFKVMRWKNFLSTGNEFTEINLNRSPSTLIIGANGAGKSTMLDALSFGLFGKAHRNINKVQLVNSINNKAAVVEIEFDIGIHTFKIIRGIKPNIFEIWQNGNMINQAAASRDYQKFLEQNILKLNHKSFHQIVVLGSSSFVPFMQLPAGSRREVIEDLLDIQVFGRMNSIVKDKLSRLKEEINSVTHVSDMIKEKILMQKKYIKDITEINSNLVSQKTQQINELESEIDKIKAENFILSDNIIQNQEGLNDRIQKLNKKRATIFQYETKFKQQVDMYTDDKKFYEHNTNCPSCTQVITEDVRIKKITDIEAKTSELSVGIQKASEELQNLDTMLSSLTFKAAEISDWNNTLISNNNIVTRIQKQINALNTEINTVSRQDGDLSKANTEYQDFLDQKETLTEKKLNLLDLRTYTEAAHEMLKDTGIKTKIVKEYLPVMNTLINKYLSVLDFFVSFNLDENFNEVIKSRYRDDFNYSSFSEGEKQRINLSLLFTWRHIARMKNSSSTNLLILDETFDSSIDQDGVENLMKILSTLGANTNTFIISHKGEILEDKFRAKIEFTKENNFSKMLHSTKNVI
jgi:DNA repair exonuclease SbcCD ATPase subunit